MKHVIPEIHYCNNIYDKDIRCAGIVYPSINLILIENELPKLAKLHVLIHEMIHYIIYKTTNNIKLHNLLDNIDMYI